MANILEFVRGLLTDPEAQRLFRSDTDGFVARAGFDDLTGEDVVEAILVLRRSLPPDVAAALGDFDDESRLPRIRPSFDERQLDPALRLLHHAVDATAGIAGAGGGGGAGAAHERVAVEVEPELEPLPPIVPTPPDHPDSPAHHEPIETESELSRRPDVPAREPVAAQLSGTANPAVDRFVGALEAAAADAASLLAEYADEVMSRLSTILSAAEDEAAAIRSGADADRHAARSILDEARAEGDRIRAEAEEGRADLQRRREELREAERELRERLSGLEGVFRTVLRDDD
jgi:hypothetical protein